MLPDGHLTAEEVNRLRIEYPHPFFFENRVPPLPDEAIERLSKEDLNVIAYMPKRDDFEHVCFGRIPGKGSIFFSGRSQQCRETSVDRLDASRTRRRTHR